MPAMRRAADREPLPQTSRSVATEREGDSAGLDARLVRERDAWDALVAANPASGFMQSWAWAEFKAREGYRTWPLGVYRAGALVAGALLHGYPGGAGGGLLFAPEGPVLPWDAPDLARAAL